MKIFITGATGYIGHKLALSLAQQGHSINALVRDPNSIRSPRHGNIRLVKGDIGFPESLLTAAKDCDLAYHVAGLINLSEANAAKVSQINVAGTENVLKAALLAGVKRFVFTSTCGIFNSAPGKLITEDIAPGPFDNSYDRSKFLAENLVREYSQDGFETMTTYLTKVFGPGIETHSVSTNRIIGKFIRGQINICPASGNFISNYAFIDDIINGLQLVMEKGKQGGKYILGGENISYDDFFEILSNCSGKRANTVHVPRWIAKIYAELYLLKAKFSEPHAFITSHGIDKIYSSRAVSSDKAISELNYSITPFYDAVERTIDFLNNENRKPWLIMNQQPSMLTV